MTEPTASWAFPGFRSFVPWRGHTILKVSFPTLLVGGDSIGIKSGKNVWDVPWNDVRDILFDPKAILIRRRDGTSGRFKASKKTIKAVLHLLDERNVTYSRAEGSTFWLVNAEPKSTPPDH